MPRIWRICLVAVAMYTKTSPASALGPVAWCSDGKRWEDMTGLFIKNLEKWRKMTENDGGVVFFDTQLFLVTPGFKALNMDKAKILRCHWFWWLKHDCKGFYRVIGGPPMALWCELAAVDSPSHITIQRPQRTHVWCSQRKRSFCFIAVSPRY